MNKHQDKYVVENKQRDWINLVPLLLVIFSYSISLGGKASGNSSQQMAFLSDPSRLITLGTAYLLACGIALKSLSSTFELFRRNLPYLLLLFYILSSMLWSLFPFKVLVNWGHYMGLTFTAIAAVEYFERYPIRTFQILSCTLSLSLVVSIFTSVFFPATGLHYTGRWQGLTGNPNTLGLIGVVSIWTNMASLVLRKQQGLWAIVHGVFLLITGITLIKGRSVTSIFISLFILSALPLLISMEYNTVLKRTIKFGVTVWFITLGLFGIYAFAPELLSPEVVLEAVGRDTTLSGRVNIWEKGIALIIEKPLYGWSFDSLASILSTTTITAGKFYSVGQFHNGYFDLGVRGGSLALGFLAVLLFTNLHGISVMARTHFRLSIVFLVLTCAVAIHNFAEASFLRTTHLLWMIYLFSYFSVQQVPLKEKMLSARENSRNLFQYRTHDLVKVQA